MPSTPRLGLQHPATSDPATAYRTMLQNHAVTLDAAAIHLQGTIGARPAHGLAGRRYYATDQGVEYLDIGSAWVTIGPVAPGSIGTTELANNSVTAAKIAPDAVGFDELQPASVGVTELNTAAVTTPKIADGQVTLAKMAASSVNTGTLVDDAVTATKIAAGAVGTSEIADDAVTAAKLSEAAKQELFGRYRLVAEARGYFDEGMSTGGVRIVTDGGRPALTPFDFAPTSASPHLQQPPALVWAEGAQHDVPGLLTRFKLYATLLTNNVNHGGGTATFGLHSISQVGGGNDVVNVGIGGAVGGSTAVCTFTSGQVIAGTSNEFLPSPGGLYCFGVSASGTIPGNGASVFWVGLFVRNVLP